MTALPPAREPPRRGRPRKHPVPDPAAPQRKRGGQPGNRNRWRHGRRSRAAAAAHAALKADIAAIEAEVARILAEIAVAADATA